MDTLLVKQKSTPNKTVEILQSYGYAAAASVRDVKELARALLTDPNTKQQAFELVLGRPVPVTEIVNTSALHKIWNTAQDPVKALDELEIQRSVEALSFD